jgi:beta-glucanase (GH16 family)
VTKDTITWFIDGKEVAKKPNKYWHEPMNITLSLGLRHPHLGWVGQDMQPIPKAATDEGFPTEMEVDWVRVWERM